MLYENLIAQQIILKMSLAILISQASTELYLEMISPVSSYAIAWILNFSMIESGSSVKSDVDQF